MSKTELDTLRLRALSTLQSSPLSAKELAESLREDQRHVREVIWQLVNRREIEFTRDWKIMAADLQAA